MNLRRRTEGERLAYFEGLNKGLELALERLLSHGTELENLTQYFADQVEVSNNNIETLKKKRAKDMITLSDEKC